MRKSAKYSKAKGRRLQNYVRDRLKSEYPIVANDIRSAIMGESGVDIKLSEEAKKQIPFDIECKAVEKLNIQAAYEQSVKNSEENRIPIVVHKRSRKQPLVTLDFETFLNIISLLNNQKKEKNKEEE